MSFLSCLISTVFFSLAFGGRWNNWGRSRRPSVPSGCEDFPEFDDIRSALQTATAEDNGGEGYHMG